MAETHTDATTEELKNYIQDNPTLFLEAFSTLPHSRSQFISPEVPHNAPISHLLDLVNTNSPNGSRVEIIDFARGPYTYPQLATKNQLLLALRISNNSNQDSYHPTVINSIFKIHSDDSLTYEGESGLRSSDEFPQKVPITLRPSRTDPFYRHFSHADDHVHTVEHAE